MNQADTPRNSYSETGGIRHGETLWSSTNWTWPFATLTATSRDISIRLGFGKLRHRTFVMPREHIRALRRKKGLFSTGVLIDHTVPGDPPFILFWTFRYATFKRQLEALGYQVED